MKAKYNYLVTGVKTYPVIDFLDFLCEAYTDEQARYFFKQKYGYKGIRDIRAIRGTAVVNDNQLPLSQIV